MVARLKILVWENVEDKDEEPLVDITMPVYLAKWADRMMKFIPKRAREEMWGEGVELGDFNLQDLIKEAIDSGEKELMEIKARDRERGKRVFVKIFLEE